LNRLPAIALSLALPVASLAQEESPAVAAWIGDLRTWLKANVDEGAFEVVGLDAAGIDDQLRQLQEAAAQPTPDPPQPSRADADTLIEILNQYELTETGAAWLEFFLHLRPEQTAAEKPSATPVAPAIERLDPVRLEWEQRLAVRPMHPRAADYIVSLKAIFAREGVPPELVWIAELESGFNPAARSRVGAVGLFQLMPDTAEELGLTINLIEDERCDPDKSARAAARYLRSLRRQFEDWQLAIAAYNAGPGRVAYLLGKLETNSFAAIAHRLPEETQEYVAKVEATVWIREGVELRDLPAGPTRDGSARLPFTGPRGSGSSPPPGGHGWVTPPVGRGG
jgi:membrane-bound lytic murein transglycosylase D